MNLFSKATIGLIVLCVQPAFAGNAVDMTGTWTGMAKNQIFPISEGHMVMRLQSDYAKFDGATDGPMASMTGACFGSVELAVPALTGDGHCVFTDKNGDTMASNWRATGMSKEGATIGEWTIVGGTGAYANATGGGAFHSLTNMETGAFQNKISGAMVMN